MGFSKCAEDNRERIIERMNTKDTDKKSKFSNVLIFSPIYTKSFSYIRAADSFLDSTRLRAV